MRYPSVDILRTVAIGVMVLVHFPENLSGYTPPFAGLGAPLFAFLSGVSYRLWLNGQQSRSVDETEISKISIRRGLFVFGVGFAFNILIWLPEDTFNWDVLTFIGTAILILNVMRNKPIAVSVALALTSAAISPALRAIVDYSTYWQNGYFDPDLTLPDLFTGFFVAGYFPFFPWIAYTLVGFVNATLLFPDNQKPPPPIGPYVLFGSGLIGLSTLGYLFVRWAPASINNGSLAGWTMFPPSLVYLLGTIGMAMIGLCSLHHFVDRRQGLDTNSNPLILFKTFSRYAFTIYLLHHMAHLWPLWIYGFVYGSETTEFWGNALPVAVSLSLGAAFLVVCYIVLRRLNPDNRHGVEGWMRWLCG
jgi:uncharacterized membrane protein